jgi:hypothetical protein
MNTMQNQSQSQTGDAMLSSKNLTILEDQMSTAALNCKKMEMYSQTCSDPQLKDLFTQAAQMHRQHFDVLFNYLNSHNKPSQQQQQ